MGNTGFPLGDQCSSRGVKEGSEMGSFWDGYMCTTLKFIERRRVLQSPGWDYSFGVLIVGLWVSEPFHLADVQESPQYFPIYR